MPDKPTLDGPGRKILIVARSNVTIDWTLQENVGARFRVQSKRILRKHGYPPGICEEGNANGPGASRAALSGPGEVREHSATARFFAARKKTAGKADKYLQFIAQARDS